MAKNWMASAEGYSEPLGTGQADEKGRAGPPVGRWPIATMHLDSRFQLVDPGECDCSVMICGSSHIVMHSDECLAQISRVRGISGAHMGEAG